jgi:hypothetical protein
VVFIAKTTEQKKTMRPKWWHPVPTSSQYFQKQVKPQCESSHLLSEELLQISNDDQLVPRSMRFYYLSYCSELQDGDWSQNYLALSNLPID